MKANIFATLASLGVILLFCISIRLWYQSIYPNPIVSGDTYGYFLVGKHMLSSQYPWFSFVAQRPPVYPLFLQLPLLLTHTYPTDMFTPEFSTAMQTIVTIQSILGIISAFLVYWIAGLLAFSRWERITISILIGINIALVSWERVLVTESLTVPLLLMYMLVMLSLFKKYSLFLMILLLILSIIALFLKPLYLFLPMTWILLFWMYRKNRRLCLQIGGATVIWCIFVGTQLISNRVYHGYTGFAYVSDINILGRMLKTHLPVPKNLTSSMYYDPYRSYQVPETIIDPPFQFLDSIDPAIVAKPDDQALEALHQFVLASLIASPIPYIQSAIIDIPQALVWNWDTTLQSWFTFGLQALRYAMNILSLTILIIVPWAIISAIRAPTRTTLSILTISIVCMGQLILTVLVGYGSYERLMIGTVPLTFLCVWYFARIIVHRSCKFSSFRPH